MAPNVIIVVLFSTLKTTHFLSIGGKVPVVGMVIGFIPSSNGISIPGSTKVPGSVPLLAYILTLLITGSSHVSKLNVMSLETI
jgi:cobalamin synthase